MKTFTFRLESVLNLRAREEDAARDLYAHALGVSARITGELRDARSEIASYHAVLTREREGVSSRQHQLIFLNALQQHQMLCDRLVKNLAIAEREVAARRDSMLEARRRREALTRLKEKQQSAHNAESARAEESMIGDLITARHALGMMEEAA